jgi:hypothetical protein
MGSLLGVSESASAEFSLFYNKRSSFDLYIQTNQASVLFWKRAVLTNACAVAGVCIAFALSEAAKPSLNIRVRIAVFARLS